METLSRMMSAVYSILEALVFAGASLILVVVLFLFRGLYRPQKRKNDN